jgi:DNA-binding CsgD family transcriptional regulator
LESFANFVGGHGAFHIIANPSTGAINCSEQVGVDPTVNELYQRYYATKEVRIPPALAHGVGKVVTEGRLLDRKIYESSEIYGELLRPYDIPHIMAMWLQRTPQACQAVVVEAGYRHGPFDQDALSKYAAIAPHLIRAARIRELLASARQAHLLNHEIVSRLPIGVMLLDRTASVIAASARAEEILRQDNGLRVRQARLHADFPDDDRQLQEEINRATRRGCVGALPGATLSLRRRGMSALGVSIIPMSPSNILTMTPEPVALLVVSDPAVRFAAPAELIKRALRLTEAESVLAATLFTGITLREAAERLGKSFHTCKVQLRSIYAKTGSRNHVDLTKALFITTLADPKSGGHRE